MTLYWHRCLDYRCMVQYTSNKTTGLPYSTAPTDKQLTEETQLLPIEDYCKR